MKVSSSRRRASGRREVSSWQTPCAKILEWQRAWGAWSARDLVPSTSCVPTGPAPHGSEPQWRPLCQGWCYHPVCTAKDISGLAKAAVVRGLDGSVPGSTCVQGPQDRVPLGHLQSLPQAPRGACLSFRHTAQAEPALGHVVNSEIQMGSSS